MGYIPYGFVQKPTGIFIEPQQAKVVQQIYQRYLAGDSLEGIADFLFNELKVAEMIDTIFIQENGTLEIEYKGQGFSQSMVLSLN